MLNIEMMKSKVVLIDLGIIKDAYEKSKLGSK